jgi:uncharacterized protein YxeA
MEEKKIKLENQNQENKKINLKIITIIFLIIVIIISGYLFYKCSTSVANSIDNKKEQITSLQNEIKQYKDNNNSKENIVSENLCKCKPFLNEGKETKYAAVNNLEQSSFQNENISSNEYKLFNHENFSFYYPLKWEISSNEKGNIFSIDFTESGGNPFRFEILQENTTDFITKYNECIAKCFVVNNRSDISKNEYIEYRDFYSDIPYCSENNNPQNLSRLLSGEYIDLTKTGMLPGGGTSNTLLRKVINSETVKIRFNSDSIQDLPVWKELTWDNIPVEGKKGFTRGLSNESQIKLEDAKNEVIEFLQIITESFEFKN